MVTALAAAVTLAVCFRPPAATAPGAP